MSTDRNRDRNPRPVSSHTWDEFSHVYPIYAALARQGGLPNGPYPAVANIDSWPDKKTRERDLLWLDDVDRQVQAVHIRQFLATPAAAREEGLRIFLQRQLLKPDKQMSDRDKIDLLIVQYFVLCAPQDMIAVRLEFADVAKVLQPALGEVEETSLECCEPFERILESTQQCRSLRDLVEQGLMEQGRFAKEAAGGMFYDPVALVSICRFNFIFRRTFIQLLHADLRAIGSALNELERRGPKTIDCRGAGLSSAESVAKLRQFHQTARTCGARRKACSENGLHRGGSTTSRPKGSHARGRGCGEYRRENLGTINCDPACSWAFDDHGDGARDARFAVRLGSGRFH